MICRSRRAALGLIVTAGLVFGAARASAAQPAGHIYFNAAGQLDFSPPAGWTLESRSRKDGRDVLEYRFGLPEAPGAQASARVSLRQLARSIKLKDLTPQEVQAVERARDAAFEDRSREVDTLPGVRFLSGGTQFIYTALEDGRRFHYVHFVGVTGVPAPGSDLSPAVSIDLRCRNAVDEEAPRHAAAAEALEATCYALMRDL